MVGQVRDGKEGKAPALLFLSSTRSRSGGSICGRALVNLPSTRNGLTSATSPFSRPPNHDGFSAHESSCVGTKIGQDGGLWWMTVARLVPAFLPLRHPGCIMPNILSTLFCAKTMVCICWAETIPFLRKQKVIEPAIEVAKG
jgi:hypothetical protein